MPNNHKQSPLALARQLKDPYILLIFLIQLIKQTCKEFEDRNIKPKSRQYKEATKSVASMLTETLEILETLESLDKQQLAFKLGCLSASPEANPINPTMAYNLLRQISEEVGPECFRQANIILFKLLIGKKVRLQYQEWHALERSSLRKSLLVQKKRKKKAWMKKEEDENRELLLRYEIEFVLNSGQPDEIDIKKLMAEYCLGTEASMVGIEELTGVNTKSNLVLAERLMRERKERIRERDERKSGSGN